MRPTREHTPLDDRLITQIVEKRHDARTSEDRLVRARRQPRQTRAMFLARMDAYYLHKYGARRTRS